MNVITLWFLSPMEQPPPVAYSSKFTLDPRSLSLLYKTTNFHHFPCQKLSVSLVPFIFTLGRLFKKSETHRSQQNALIDEIKVNRDWLSIQWRGCKTMELWFFDYERILLWKSSCLKNQLTEQQMFDICSQAKISFSLSNIPVNWMAENRLKFSSAIKSVVALVT